MLIKFLRFTCVMLLTLSLSCASKKLESSFWAQETSTISIGIVPYPVEGQTYRIALGQLGWLLPTYRPVDYLDAGLSQYVRKYNYSAIDLIKNDFAAELSKRSFRVIPLNDLSVTDQNPELKKWKGEINNKILSVLRINCSADYLILFTVKRCGVGMVNNYITTPYYYSTINVLAQLVDLRSGDIKWRYDCSSVKRIKDDWNHPPDYANISIAINELITPVRRALYIDFFKENLNTT